MVDLKKIIFFLSFFFILNSQSQDLILDGIVSGYNYNPTKGLFNKGTEVLLEGRLDNVAIVVKKNLKVYRQVKTDDNGDFHLELPLGKEYRIELNKTGYGRIAFDIDLTKTKVDTDLNFWSLELILNSHLVKNEPKDIPSIGILNYANAHFNFEELKQKSNIFNKQIDHKPLISLIHESIEKNSPNVLESKGKSNTGIKINGNLVTIESDDSIVTSLYSQGISPEIVNNKAYVQLVLTSTENSEITILDRESLIVEAKKQLEIDRLNAKTPLDFILIANRETLIIAAENELANLKEIIIQKDKALKLKNTQLILFLIVFALLIVMTLFILRSNKIKSKLNKDLANKNQKISDSIDYAVKIQSAILPTQLELNKLVDSFIMFSPKDKVSGDYYWFHEVDGKIIVAAVDCTGHGVPGAFMSMIGTVLMNTIIIERQITSPKLILESLHTELQQALHQNGSDPFAGQDGMDLSICVIDKIKKEISYAGAMNALYLLKDNKIETLTVSNKGVGGFDVFSTDSFKEESINLEKGTQLYMLSDGFMDQFGGNNAQKYNLDRFKTLLLSCHAKSTKEQKDLFELALTNWKGDLEQTDDVLVIGINL